MPAPMVYPKGNPRYGSIETAGWTGLQKKLHTRTHTYTVYSARPRGPGHAVACKSLQECNGQTSAAVFGHEIGDWRMGDWGLEICKSYNCSRKPATRHCWLLYEPHVKAQHGYLQHTRTHTLSLYLSPALTATARWINAASCVTLER